MEYKKHTDKIIWQGLSGIFVLLPLVPMLALDVLAEIFHRICFPIYGIAYIKRSDYIIFDRQKLSYLPFYDKFFCTYCAYANGVFLYWSAIGSATEKYWCAIKHQNLNIKIMKEKEKDYLEYGDKKAFENFKK